ncbi:MAG TPA: hypothetical protein VJP40_09115, partial [bacterium]|nr:hypothetical protein [bacterium]
MTSPARAHFQIDRSNSTLPGESPLGEVWIDRLVPALHGNGGQAFLNECQSLARESDEELFFQGLWSLARRQESRGRPDLALSIFQLLQSSDVPASYRRRAEDAVAGYAGGGSF